MINCLIRYGVSNVFKGSNGDCGVKNGGCSQLCFSMKSGFRCGCVQGMRLASDQKTCISSKYKSIVVKRHTFFMLTI